MVGLDGAGKTTMLYHLRLREPEKKFSATNGYNHEIVQRIYDRKRFDFHMWDLSGKPELRRVWKYYYRGTIPDVVFFVVDANDRKRLAEARSELMTVFREPELVGVIKVVVLNVKADDETKTSAKEVSTLLGVDEIKGSKIKVFETNAYTGEGFDKLLNYVCMTTLHSR